MIKENVPFEFVDPNNPDRPAFMVKIIDGKLIREDGIREDFVGVKWEYVQSCADHVVINSNPSLDSFFS